MRDFLRKLLYGRYGVDQFSTVIVICSVVLSLLYTFTHWGVLYILSTASMLYAIYRIFSRNFAKRQG